MKSKVKDGKKLTNKSRELINKHFSDIENIIQQSMQKEIVAAKRKAAHTVKK